MPKPIDVLDQMSVASPCSADWDEMTGNDQIRFCRHCSQHVHDLSKLTRKEAMRLVAASEGRLCVRYRKRPDGTLDTAERAAEPLTQIKRRLSRIAAGAFTASLSLASNVAAQSARPAAGNQPVAIQPSSTATLGRFLFKAGQTASLAGTVFDPQQAVVTGAVITITNDATRESQTVTSNEEGAYQFQAVAAGVYTLTVQSPGFSIFEQMQVVVRDGAQVRVDATLAPGAIMGDMIVVTPSTPLVKAVWEQDLNKVRDLLAEGVDVNAVDAGMYVTALAAAVEGGRPEFVRELVQAGADPNVRNPGGRTALMGLDADATPEVVRLLLANGAEVNLKDGEGHSALHLAAAIAKGEVLRALLEAGAIVDERDVYGNTPLMAAAENGNVDNVEALLSAGADPRLKNKDGETALKLAADNDHQEVVALLQAYGAYE
ncbi:MAG TPA: ankyrin repeat domain-containing protein [Pyrinomonadaceae bacterium]|nr:ankyrin repeat domain-containing protein [Pyrinomonadaceae bacterium]